MKKDPIKLFEMIFKASDKALKMFKKEVFEGVYLIELKKKKYEKSLREDVLSIASLADLALKSLVKPKKKMHLAKGVITSLERIQERKSLFLRQRWMMDKVRLAYRLAQDSYNLKYAFCDFLAGLEEDFYNLLREKDAVLLERIKEKLLLFSNNEDMGSILSLIDDYIKNFDKIVKLFFSITKNYASSEKVKLARDKLKMLSNSFQYTAMMSE